jgi:hypothetical protein
MAKTGQNKTIKQKKREDTEKQITVYFMKNGGIGLILD